jgi:hypothetical protein
LSALKGNSAVVELLLIAHASVAAVDAWGKTPLHSAAAAGHTETVRFLLAAPKLSAKVLARAAQAAAAAGHAELAIVVLKALVAQRDKPPPAAAAVFANQSVTAGVLGLWETAKGIIREEEARWPELHWRLLAAACDWLLQGPTSSCSQQQQISAPLQSVLGCSLQGR